MAFGIRLAYPPGPVVAFAFDTIEEGQARITEAHLTQPRDRPNPRWVDAAIVEVADRG